MAPWLEHMRAAGRGPLLELFRRRGIHCLALPPRTTIARYAAPKVAWELALLRIPSTTQASA